MDAAYTSERIRRERCFSPGKKYHEGGSLERLPSANAGLGLGGGGQGCAIVERVMTKLRQGQRPKNRATTICGRRCGHDPQKNRWPEEPASMKLWRQRAPAQEAAERPRWLRLRRAPGRSMWDARERAGSARSFWDRIPAELWHWRRRPAAA